MHNQNSDGLDLYTPLQFQQTICLHKGKYLDAPSIPITKSPSDPRTQTIVTRMTPAEMAAIEAMAEASGQNRSEWLRQAALAYLGTTDNPADATTDLITLAEIMGLRSLILNLFAVLPGVAVETVRAIMSNADSIKRGDAERTLSRACQDGTPE